MINKMTPTKKTFLTILALYISVGFILPWFYFFQFGLILNYTDTLELNYFNKAISLNLISIMLSAFLIYLTPSKSYQLKVYPDVDNIIKLTIFFYIVSISLWYFCGGFDGVLQGGQHVYLIHYLNYFLNPLFLLAFIVLLQNKTFLFKLIITISYLVLITLQGSRAGVFLLVLIFLYGYSFEAFNYIAMRYKKILKVLILLSPLIYLMATKLRGGGGFEGGLRGLFDFIVVRLSLIELSAIPIKCLDTNLCNLDFFYQKYSISNQLHLILNAAIPSDFFDFDIMPNNYYQYIFLDKSESYVRNNYMSMNMSLPTYLYLYFGNWAMLIVPFSIFLYYLIVNFFRNNPLVFLALIICFYELLLYFDFVMIFKTLLSSLLTGVMIKLIRKARIYSIVLNGSAKDGRA
jgi:hypothetical protein